jgi:phosphopantothenoylcysteine decarboxylase / phosphopantothenate---cysteine ligase
MTTIALCVTGSIAAYKAVEVARLLIKAGHRVLPVMTTSAARFIGPVTLAGVCGESVAMDMWDRTFGGEMHVRLAEQVDIVAIVPATADILARLAHGRADDLVAALALCARGPVIAAPAMHTRMWLHPATKRNVAEIAAQGLVKLVGPVSGEVASGDIGLGRMAEPEEVVAAIVALRSPQDLHSLHIVVTAGPTLEDFDPVRFLGNRSTGKMGFAVAERASARGAQVTLVAGPTSLATPASVVRIDVRSAVAMRAALWQALGRDLARADALVMAAAVADYRPSDPSTTKIKKDAEHVTLDLVRNPDLVAEVGKARTGKRPILVGFALESETGEALAQRARHKLFQKGVDLVVANQTDGAFGHDVNQATIVTATESDPLPRMSKWALADIVLDRVRLLLGS